MIPFLNELMKFTYYNIHGKRIYYNVFYCWHFVTNINLSLSRK